MNFFYFEYSTALFFLIIVTILAMIIFFLSYFIVTQTGGSEKLSAYECGFEPFEDSRNIFDVRFYVIALLFIIFYLEVSYLFPWAVSLHVNAAFGFWTMMFFLILLTVGFIYEWKKGALD